MSEGDAERVIKLGVDRSECGRFIRLHFGQVFVCELVQDDAYRFAESIMDVANALSFVPPMNFNPERKRRKRLMADKPVKLDDGSFIETLKKRRAT